MTDSLITPYGGRLVDLTQGPLVECGGDARRAGTRRIGLDCARHEAKRPDGVETIVEAAGQLLATKRELVQPGRVVDGHGQTPVGEAAGLSSAGGVGADDLGPRPTNAVLEQSISQVRDRGEQKISNGARRSTVHVLASYILSVAGRESG